MSFNTKLIDIASSHFQEATAKIESIRKGIQDNRLGEATLTDIQTDSSKLSKRIARENMPVSAALERINGVPNFQDIQILYKILRISETVGRITIKTRYGNSGYGTGFLVAPGILITNNHVFPDAETAKNSVVQFYYELDENNECKKVQTFGFSPEKFFITSNYLADAAVPDSGLDFTLVAITDKSKEGKSSAEIPHTILDETLGKIIEGENCVIIQHPKGDYKKTVMKDIRMLTLKDDFLIYESDTLPGSSGAVVIGLGTGEVVALHHSSVPNKNPQGQWLRKDGGVYKDGDPDESIDWLGNEGIRVSSLVRAIRNANLSPEMASIRKILFGFSASPNKIKPSDPSIAEKPIPMKTTSESVLNQAVNMLPQTTVQADLPIQYFEIELSAIVMMQEDWKENFKKLMPEICSSEPLFPLSTIPSQRSLHYITLRSNANPWEISAQLEALPQIKTALPDLEMQTDLAMKSRNTTQLTESDMMERMKVNNAAGRQDDFKAKWNASPYFELSDPNVEKQRSWNRTAVGFSEITPDLVALVSKQNSAKADHSKVNNAANPEANFLEELRNIQLVQLDTGYTDHAKVKNRFNFNSDEDFIDGSDARDENQSGVLRHPGHGSRMASIIIGGSMSNIYKSDGNSGILCDHEKENLLEIIPYRIAETVSVVNRAKNVVDAANMAIHTNSDILLMSMGSYPRPMLAQAVKAAYDNGLIWVCASGNEVEMVVAPALLPGTIAVAATNPNEKPWRGSSYGPEIDISAPGEDIYVPALDEKYNEIMVYGSGTGYAAAHVAAAAAAWKAKHRKELAEKYHFPWQIVEAFRTCLKNSANQPAGWDTTNYGLGILDIAALLLYPLPEADTLKYIYSKGETQEWDLGVREIVHFLWAGQLSQKKTAMEVSNANTLTERSRIAITAMTGHTVSSMLETDSLSAITDADKILKMYFESYKNN